MRNFLWYGPYGPYGNELQDYPKKTAKIFVMFVFIWIHFWCEMLISAHFVSLLKLFWCILNKVFKNENEDCNWQLISHWISNFQFIRLSWIMQMRSFGTFLGIIVMVGLGSTVRSYILWPVEYQNDGSWILIKAFSSPPWTLIGRYLSQIRGIVRFIWRC